MNCEVLSNFFAIRIHLKIEAQVIPLYKQTNVNHIFIPVQVQNSFFLCAKEGKSPVGVMGQLPHNSISSPSLWFGSELA